MTAELTQRELRNNSGQVMAKLDAGEDFIVTRNGVPVAQLTPLRSNRFVKVDVIRNVYRGAPTVNQVALRADLDAIADPSIEPHA